MSGRGLGGCGRDERSLCRLPLERFHQPTHIGPNDDLVAVELRDYFRNVADRRQVLALHVRSGLVVVIHPLTDDVIQVPVTEQNELEQALEFDRLNEPLDSSVQIRGRHRQGVGANALCFQSGHEFLGELGVSIVHQNRGLLCPSGRLFDERLGLLYHPAGIGCALSVL